MLQVDEKLVKLVEDIVVSYETQISAVGNVIDNTHQMLRESKAALGQVNSRLRETLADNASLRKTDFDNMIAEVLSQQEERHQEVRRALSEFTQVHRESARKLKGLLVDAQSGRPPDFRPALNEIQARQDKAEKEVIRLLKNAQANHERILAEARRLLNNNHLLKVEDFKASLSKLRTKEGDKVSEQAVKAGTLPELIKLRMLKEE